MRFEDQPASGADTGAADPTSRPRRRTPRSWSVPAGTERFDKPLSDDDWAKEPPPPPRAGTSTRSRRVSDPPPPPAPPPGPDLGPLTGFLGDLRVELGQLRAALEASATASDGSLVTGTELADTIEALGTTLGSGIASLLTEHRNLLARDVEGAAVRILEEVSQRLRASGTQIVDGVEERVRHVNAKALGDVVEQLDLRLDQIQADVTGLRAVMLELPDQTAVVERLDQLAESVGGGRGRDTARLTPAMGAAIERSVANAVDRVQRDVDSLGGSIRELLEERSAKGGGGEGFDPGSLEALTTEMMALRRRISLRTDARGEAVELSDRQLDDLADRIAARMGGATPPKAKTATIRVDDEDDDEGEAAEIAPKRTSKRASKRR